MAASVTPLSVLIVTDPYAETSDDAIAIAGALADVGHLVLGVRAGDASLPEAMARLKPDVAAPRGCMPTAVFPRPTAVRASLR